MDFRYRGLQVESFAPLFSLTDKELERRSVRRMLVDEKPGFPCRVTLEDAEPGEKVLLLAYEHQPANSPFRAAGPIFVRENALDSFDRVGAPPSVLMSRLLSVRAYAQDGMMVDADVAEGGDLEMLLERLFAREDAAYAHIHFARRGCFACRVERAQV
jgi:hypothetical protein